MTLKKICVVVLSRANYGRIKHLMIEIKRNPQLELQLIVGASAVLERFGKPVDIIKNDGFQPDEEIHYAIEGETLLTQAKTTGLGIIEIANALDRLSPDCVVTVADRFETMSTAIAASYLNIPLVHVQGGEVSGNIDDRVRHAITKLSDYHFPSSNDAYERILKLGEEKERVFNFGCPAMDILKQTDLSISNNLINNYIPALNSKIDFNKDYILMVQHPVTTSFGNGLEEINHTLSALKKIDCQKLVLFPNIDAGSDDVSYGITKFVEKNDNQDFTVYTNFSPDDYAKVLKNAKCCIGNSSSFIRECSFLGVPSVIVGDRQSGREVGRNVIFSTYDSQDILEKVNTQLEIRSYSMDPIFGDGEAGINIANKLAELDFQLKREITF
jgi:UDP-hydrolysing UDP-N-acetyl-D-glucosamine 2-epimerase